VAFTERYRTGRTLARARTGSVRLAIDAESRDRVVLKELVAHASAPLGEFEDEAARLAALTHEGLARVHGVVRDEARAWVVMEYVPGRTLDDLTTAEESVGELRLLTWARQICLALEAMHREGLLFRGLDPGDVMVGTGDGVRLIDFGLGRFRRSGDDTVAVVGTALTPGFAAPEQYVGYADARSDVHALGAILFFLLAGGRPDIGDPLALLDLRRSRRDVSRRTFDAIEAMLEVERARRPGDMRAVMDLLGVADTQFAVPRPVPVTP
jgi:serine/threonine-protein kinase